MADLRKLVIDGEEFEFDPDLTVLQACEEAGKEIPRFCYHERLSIAGNCRMCLVEAVGAPKPMASCAMQVKDLRGGRDGEPPEIRTDSAIVKKAREGVMEFLLINHPLDCPICDQGGECDLQDQAMAYGGGISRFAEPKRAMADINLGPLIKTHMTRCIQCTRCVRFATEIAGVPEMGCTGRGEDAEIVSYLDAALGSELQGNVIDLCPVGALTSRPYAFSARPWELRKTETIDVMDALGSNIRVDAEGSTVRRVMPLNHDGINEEWISDKTRFAVDGLARQRLDRPYIRGADGKLAPASWDAAFAAIKDKIGAAAPEKVMAVAGDLVSVEAMWALKALMAQVGGSTECRTDGAALPSGNRSGYVGTAKIEDIDTADMIMLIGTNPRLEAAVLNARIRGAWVRGAEIGVIGEAADLTYEYAHMGAGRDALRGLVDKGVSDETRDKKTLVILGQGAISGADGAAVLAAVQSFCAASKSQLLVLHTAASRVGGMDIGFTSEGGMAALGGAQVVYNMGADEADMPSGAFVVYQGSHGDRGAHRADVILPGATYTEQSGLYVNTEGRPQMTHRAAFPPGEAKEDWAIIRALSERLGEPLGFDTIEQIRAQVFEAAPHLARLGAVEVADLYVETGGNLGDGDFTSPVGDFYLTNPIARASETMAACSKLAQERAGHALAAE